MPQRADRSPHISPQPGSARRRPAASGEHIVPGTVISLQAVIIDLDGTLADTFPAMRAAYSRAAGRVVHEDELLGLFGPGAGTECEILLALGATGSAALDLWYEHYDAAHESLQPFPGMRELLAAARRQEVSTGMLTGKGRRSTMITLERLGVADLLDVVVTGDEAPAPKPDPRGLRMVVEQLAVIPGSTIYIGDSIADLDAARAAGVRIAAALWDPRATIAHSSMLADLVLRTPADLDRILLPLTAGDKQCPPAR